MTSAESVPERYAIRPFVSGDRASFLDLYRETFGVADEEWFTWKYEETPGTSEIPITVADHEGRIVAVRPCVPFEMRANGSSLPAIRFGDTMVHPDHRRNGLFTRTTERMMAEYRGREAVFAFNTPNHRSLPGYRKMGGRVVRTMNDYYRIQNPEAVAASAVEGRVPKPFLELSREATRLYNGGRTRIGSLRYDTSPITVERYGTVPAETFVDIYERTVPAHVHARRTAPVYEWRFRNPSWEYTAYVARREDGPAAGVVAGTRDLDGVRVTNLAEVVPLLESDCDRDAAAAVLSRLLSEHADSDLLTHRGRALPESLLRDHGFVPSDRWPLSRVTDTAPLLVYDLAGDDERSWQAAGMSLLSPSNWLLSSYEQDAR
jgi:GNAT superfamily N-acetyltransferase